MRKRLSPKIQRRRRPIDSELTTNLAQHTASDTVLEMQQTIGNRATQRLVQPTPSSPFAAKSFSGLVMRTPKIETASAPTPTIQRNKLDDLQDSLAEAKIAIAPKTQGSRAWKTLNNRIKRLEGEIQELQATSTPEPVKEPEKISEPFKEKYPKLASSFEESAIEGLEAAVGEERLTNLLTKFTGGNLKTWIDALTLVKFTDLVSTFDNGKISAFTTKFSIDKIADLFSVYNANAINLILGDWGLDSAVDVFNHFTAAEFKVFVGVVKRDRVKYLIKTMKLTGEVLADYPAIFLRDFKGAGAQSMNHLLTVYTKSNGVISGGHDATVFNPELNRYIGSYQDDDGNVIRVRNGRITGRDTGSIYDKVYYTTHTTDGYNLNSGSKTLIHNLASNQAVWLKRANEAIWGSIRAMQFNEDGGAWSGRSDDGYNFEGYYTPSVSTTEIATFYPV